MRRAAAYIPHDHEVFTPGCHRCEIGLDEATDSVIARAEEWLKTDPWKPEPAEELVQDMLSLLKRRD